LNFIFVIISNQLIEERYISHETPDINREVFVPARVISLQFIS